MTIRSVSHAYASHRTGSKRPAHPAQLSDDQIGLLGDSSVDPQKISEMSHMSAMALLHRVHAEQDPQIVQRVLTLVDTEGLDLIAELWAKSEPDTLPGVMWRLYLLRDWMRKNSRSLPRFWTLGEPNEGPDSVIAGINEYPTAEDIIETADSILSGAFTGDFAIALDRAAVFLDVVCRGMERHAMRAQKEGRRGNEYVSQLRGAAAHLLETSRQFRRCANLWREGKLD